MLSVNETSWKIEAPWSVIDKDRRDLAEFEIATWPQEKGIPQAFEGSRGAVTGRS
jgi:hypothetical protein